jgi:hypothetical protein
MNVVEQLVTFFRLTDALSWDDEKALRAAGFLENARPWEWDFYDEYDDSWYCDGFGDDSDDRWERIDEGLRRIAAPSNKVGGRVGQSRKRWWKGYQVTQVASRRNRQR